MPAPAEQRKESNLNFQKRRIEADGALAYLQQQIDEEKAKREAAEEIIFWLIEATLRGSKATGKVKKFLDSLKDKG